MPIVPPRQPDPETLVALAKSGIAKAQQGIQPSPEEMQAIQLVSQQMKGVGNLPALPPPPQQRTGPGPVPPNPNNLLTTQSKPLPHRNFVGPSSMKDYAGGLGSD